MRRTTSVVAVVTVMTGISLAASMSTATQSSGEPPAMAAPDPRPNIVFITTDDMRVGDLVAMPNLKQLLTDQGTTFEKSYAPFPLCCPARASWLTGQYNHNNGVMGNLTPDSPVGGSPALDSSSTMATWLADAGYQTAFVGKYLNGYGAHKPVVVPPGWTEWHAAVGGGDYFSTRLRENTGGTLTTNLYNGPYQVDLYDTIARDVIGRRVPADAPLFLWVSDFAPHAGRPVEPDDRTVPTPAVPPRWRNFYSGLALPTDPSFNEGNVADKPAYVRQLSRISSATRAMLRESNQQRLESLRAVDDSVKNIVAALAAKGELANTVIAFTSDNGYMLGEHRIHSTKTVFHEPSSQVPLIIKGPGFPAAAVRSPWVASIDIAPTFAAIAGATPTLVVDGKSLLPLASQPQTWPNRNMVMEAGPTEVGGPDAYHGIRSGRWTYVEHSTGEVEFYDMQADPYQLVSLTNNNAWNAKQTELHNKLMQMDDCAGPSCRVTGIVN